MLAPMEEGWDLSLSELIASHACMLLSSISANTLRSKTMSLIHTRVVDSLQIKREFYRKSQHN
ncbi:hypothetical protein Godav_013003, partial [Gossypium davidsonii]|nr:hypothetical protein [Gossypium davidsonii]